MFVLFRSGRAEFLGNLNGLTFVTLNFRRHHCRVVVVPACGSAATGPGGHKTAGLPRYSDVRTRFLAQGGITCAIASC